MTARRMDMTEAEAKGYEQLVDEMSRLAALPDLTAEQAQRWASLAGTRAALYSERDGWQRRANPKPDGRYQLDPMGGREPATGRKSPTRAAYRARVAELEAELWAILWVTDPGDLRTRAAREAWESVAPARKIAREALGQPIGGVE